MHTNHDLDTKLLRILLEKNIWIPVRTRERRKQTDSIGLAKKFVHPLSDYIVQQSSWWKWKMCLLFVLKTKPTFWPMQYVGGKDYSSPPTLWYSCPCVPGTPAWWWRSRRGASQLTLETRPIVLSTPKHIWLWAGISPELCTPKKGSTSLDVLRCSEKSLQKSRGSG